MLRGEDAEELNHTNQHEGRREGATTSSTCSFHPLSGLHHGEGAAEGVASSLTHDTSWYLILAITTLNNPGPSNQNRITGNKQYSPGKSVYRRESVD